MSHRAKLKRLERLAGVDEVPFCPGCHRVLIHECFDLTEDDPLPQRPPCPEHGTERPPCDHVTDIFIFSHRETSGRQERRSADDH